tara:strand:+ start:8 stop:1606 length:1599 start_codon:yes stop_codon:yes gene_type:complete
MLSPINIEDIINILPELIILFTGSIILINGVTSRSNKISYYIAISGTFIGLITKLILIFVLYENMNYESIFMGTLVAGSLESLFSLIFLIALFVCLNMTKYYQDKITSFKSEFYGLLMYSTAGMMLLARSNEMITAYVSLELATLPLIALVALGKGKLSKESGLKYLVLSAVSTSFFLLGVVYIYALTGTTFISSENPNITMHYGTIFQGISHAQVNFPSDLFVSVSSLDISNIIILISIIFIFIGLLFKLGVFPFHFWIPDVYEGAPTPITMFLSVASKTAGIAILLRIVLSIFNIADVSNTSWHAVLNWPDISLSIAILSAFSMLTGNIIAIKQNSLKRMLAYSSIAQAGYILIGFVAILSSSEIKDAVYNSSVMVAYIFGYMFTNLAAFYSMGAIKQHLKSYDFNQFKGFGRIDVLNSFVLSVSMLSLIGIPPTIGFITKLFLFSSGINSGFTWLVIFGLINSVISAYYYLRIIKVLYLEKREIPSNTQLQTLKVSKIAILLLISIVVFGVYPDPIFDFCYDAINSVIN